MLCIYNLKFNYSLLKNYKLKFNNNYKYENSLIKTLLFKHTSIHRDLPYNNKMSGYIGIGIGIGIGREESRGHFLK